MELNLKNVMYSPLGIRVLWERTQLYSFVLLFMLLCGSALDVYAQSKTVLSGNIKDDMGVELPGVSIFIKGTTIGTITNNDGSFLLETSQKDGVVVFSFIGMATQELPFEGSAKLNIVMAPEFFGLNEIVAIGYGTIKKRDLTGAVSSVKAEEITSNPSSNPMEALQGKVAGLDITSESGQPGAGVTMKLRGTRSFTASTNPVFIIDGLPGDYATLNPNDIESVEVLKDASSTAIYGSSGANGVVIITTKSGAAGKTQVNFNSYLGFNGWSKLPQMRHDQSYLQGLRDANVATGNWTSEADDSRLFTSDAAYQAHLNGEYLDWPKLLMQNGSTQNYSMSISGGTEKTKAYFSMNYSDEKGQYSGDRYGVYSTNMRIDHKISDWFSAGLNFQGSFVNQDKAYAKLINAMVATPLGSAYDEDGNVEINPVIDDTNEVNLLLNTQDGVYDNEVHNTKIFINPYIEIKPIKGLSILSRLNGSLAYNRTNYFQGEGSYQYYVASGSSATGTNTNVYAAVTQNQSTSYKWENVVTYNFDINADHSFTLTGVTSYNHDQDNGSYLKQDNIQDNKYKWYNINSSSATANTSYSMSKGMGFVGRLNYSYVGRYLFSASIRRDGASQLAEGNQWNNFPAFSAGWRISEEDFMQGTQAWLRNLKLRVGYGVTGVSSIEPYTSSSNLEQYYYSLGGQKELTYNFSQFITNKSLTWEKSYNTNIGLDATLLKNRIDLTVDLYKTKTEGVIWSRSLPVNNGAYNASTNYYSSMNICSTDNRGVEVAINTRNIDHSDFKWNTAVTFAANKEKVLSLTDGTSDNITNNDFSLSIGHPVNSYYQLKKTGIWQTNEAADAAVFGLAPGDIKIDIPGMERVSEGVYVKTDKTTGNPVEYNATNKYSISDVDKQVIGHNSPDWSLGFQNNFTWKNFDLNILAFVRWGQMIDYDLLGYYDPTAKGNFPEYFNYWTTTNPSNDFPAINANKGISDYTGYYSLTYVDGSYIKIKNITLGYNLSDKLTKRFGIEKFRFYSTITNPFVFANSHLLKDYDPEMNGSLNYPLTKQLVFGVNLSF